MYIIVGLGNPGRKYEGTRHNMGFDVIDRLVYKNNIPCSGSKFHSVYGTGMIGSEKVILAKPLTYMNLSGTAVRELVDFYKIDPERELIVISDDIDLAGSGSASRDLPADRMDSGTSFSASEHRSSSESGSAPAESPRAGSWRIGCFQDSRWMTGRLSTMQLSGLRTR